MLIQNKIIRESISSVSELAAHVDFLGRSLDTSNIIFSVADLS